MEDYGTSNDHSADTPGKVEREFVLMPLFRRVRDRLRPKQTAAASELASLPPDTYLIYPDRMGNYGSTGEQMKESSQPAPQFESLEAEVAAPVLQDFTPKQIEELAPEPITVQQASVEVESHPIVPEPITVAPAQPIAAVNIASVELEPHAVAPSPQQRVRREEPIPVPVAAAEDAAGDENLHASNLAYVMQKANAPRRTSDARPPRFTKRQVTVSIPQPNWSAMRPNWALLRPAMTYGAVGFGTCLLLFLIPGLHRPATTASLPKQSQRTVATPTPQPTEQGYTLQAGVPAQQGFTMNPSAPAAASASSAKNSKPRAAVRDSEPEVIVHHYTAPKPHVMRASSGVKKYSDLD